MEPTREPGPVPDEISSWITTTYPDTVIAEAMGAIFFSLDDRHWPNFTTIVTTDEHDLGNPSDLARPGVFRLNIGVGRTTFEQLTAASPDPDYAALDEVIPHPVYARQHWIAILNPSRRTFDDVVKPLIAEAHDRLARPRRRGKGRRAEDRTTSHAEASPDATLTRVRYHAGQLLSAADLEQEQQYQRARHRRHNRLLHGIGIVRGLDVTIERPQPTGGAVVVVSPGLAIAPDGEELVLCDRTTSPVCAQRVCYVTLRLAETPTDLLPDGEPSRIEERTEVDVREDVPPGRLAIARLVLGGTTWRTDASFGPPRVTR